MGRRRLPPFHRVSIARMHEYPCLRVESVCDQIGIAVPTLVDLEPLLPQGEKKKDAENYHLRRIKFFVLNPSDHTEDAVMVSGGGPDRLPVYEPVLYDGRHRYVAAVIRGEKTINVKFASRMYFGIHPDAWLPQDIADYLRGVSDVKPEYPMIH